MKSWLNIILREGNIICSAIFRALDCASPTKYRREPQTATENLRGSNPRAHEKLRLESLNTRREIRVES